MSPTIVSLVWALVAVAAISFLTLVLYRPPKLLQDFLMSVRLSKVRLGKLEAELGDSGTPEEQAAPEQDVHHEGELGKAEQQKAYLIEERHVGEKSETVDGLSMIFKGRYQEGLQVIESASAWQKSEDDAEQFAVAVSLAATKGVAESDRESLLAKLEEIRSCYPKNPTICLLTASTLRETGFRDRSEDLMRKFLQQTEDLTVKYAIVIDYAKALSSRGEAQAGLELLEESIRTSDNLQVKSELLAALARLYKEQEPVDYFKVMSLLELALDYQPLSQELRFDVAYRYAELGMPSFAIKHYKKIISHNEDYEGALNNAGVAAHNLELPVLGTSYYSRAMEKGNTLSHANLSFLYLENGFTKDAKEILEKAREFENCHELVFKARSDIEAAKGNEESRLDAWLETVNLFQDWRILYARGRLQPVTSNVFDGRFSGEPAVLELSVDGTVVEGWFSFWSGGPKYELHGRIEGSCLRFSWKMLESKGGFSALVTQREQGRGILIAERKALKGLSFKGADDSDVPKMENVEEWRLERKA